MCLAEYNFIVHISGIHQQKHLGLSCAFRVWGQSEQHVQAVMQTEDRVAVQELMNSRLGSMFKCSFKVHYSLKEGTRD